MDLHEPNASRRYKVIGMNLPANVNGTPAAVGKLPTLPMLEPHHASRGSDAGTGSGADRSASTGANNDASVSAGDAATVTDHVKSRARTNLSLGSGGSSGKGGICASPDGLHFDMADCEWLTFDNMHWDTWSNIFYDNRTAR